MTDKGRQLQPCLPAASGFHAGRTADGGESAAYFRVHVRFVRNETKRNVDPIFDRDPSIERKGKEKKKKKEGKFFPPQTRIRDFRGSFDATPLDASLPVFSRSIAVTDCGNVYKARVTRKGEGTARALARLQ